MPCIVCVANGRECHENRIRPDARAGPVAILKLLDRGEMYGYELVEAAHKTIRRHPAMGQSTLYLLLYNRAKATYRSLVARCDKRTRRSTTA